MDSSQINEFKDCLETGFINQNVVSNIQLQPELLVNRKENPKKKVLTHLIDQFENCEEFYISVAFVTTGGVAVLFSTLIELEQKGIKGKILVSKYLNFSQPEALRKLLRFKNIELKIATKNNSHSKGYIFKNNDFYNLIVGSSNLTQTALTTNKEWNLKITATPSSSIVNKVLTEFNENFRDGISVTKDYIDAYEKEYKKQFLNAKEKHTHFENENLLINPNSMQTEALENLNNLRKQQKNKALIISATGTGKTFLSAFDAKNFNAKKLLFVVHRRNIAEKSLITFKKIFGNSRSMGIYSGKSKDVENDFLFATIQTISKKEHLEIFDKNQFDYIVIDESHRSGATSYLRFIDYFQPSFLLGMTATPERTDGNDIFTLFDHNIAYEIRLNRALEEEMLVPFHYYGISDLIIDEKQQEDHSQFNTLKKTDRAKEILAKANYYGSDNGITRGLVFCAINSDSVFLSNYFNANGYKTISLSGKNTEEERKTAIELLESDDLNKKIDYIFTVDIFNEGIDIPKVNQILMVRPTTSSIIFIQQLGRGLRKLVNKSYLTVLDFIGNYNNNYLIPIALYGDTSYNKDNIRKLISEGSLTSPGASTINFDKISKHRIFESIDSANMKLLADLKKDYNLLKFKLGHIPMMMDFLKFGSRDPYLYVVYSKSYYNFIHKIENKASFKLDNQSLKLLEFFSKEINNYKRVEESILLKHLIVKNAITTERFEEIIKNDFGIQITQETIISCINNLNFNFIREKKEGRLLSLNEIYGFSNISFAGNKIQLGSNLKQLLKDKTFKQFLFDNLEYSISKYNNIFQLNNYNEGFLLYEKYTRKDVFRILNFETNPVAQNVGGYLVSPDNKNCPIFVNYHKENDISESINYEDIFISRSQFQYMSKSNRKLTSKDVQTIMGKHGKIRLPLFLKKSNSEGSDFYYMGDINAIPNSEEQIVKTHNNKKISSVKMIFEMQTPVSDSMFKYIHITDSKQNTKQIISPIKQPEIQTEINFEQVSQIPLYNFHAAAGSFSEMQADKTFQMISLESQVANTPDYFACKVIGESMNRVIPNGSICLFKIYSGGSRSGKIVLIENFDIQDPDYNSAFTIKTYSSKKNISENSWNHTSIVLKPNSYDHNYKDLEINEDNSSQMKIIGEFIKIIE